MICCVTLGVGYATMTVVFLIDTYYSVIIAWTLFYLIASFTALPGLPWQDCSKSPSPLQNSLKNVFIKKTNSLTILIFKKIH